MTKRTANVVVAVVADIWKIWGQNHQCSYRQEGSGYIPADFQAKKVYIVVPGQVFVRERWPRQRHSLTPGLQMVAKAKNNLPAFLFAKYHHSRHFSVSDRWNRSWQTFCCPMEASWRTWRGSSKPSAKTSPPPTFGDRWTAAKSSPKLALTRPKKVPKWAHF